MIFRRCRAGAIWAATSFLFAIIAMPAEAIEPGRASTFIETLGNEAISTLTAAGIAPDAREERFKALLNKGFAVHAIARFALGRHWRNATKDQQRRYLDLFEELIVKTYASRFARYSGETFRVTDERTDGNKGGRIVETEVKRGDGLVVVVQWRVRDAKEALKIVDVVIEGVSMSITQRSDFDSVIQRNGGKVDGLLAELEAKLKGQE